MEDIIYTIDLNEQKQQVVYAPVDGKPAFRIKNPDGTLGRIIPISKSEYGDPRLNAIANRYAELKGREQLEKDAQIVRAKKEKEAAKPKPDPESEVAKPKPDLESEVAKPKSEAPKSEAPRPEAPRPKPQPSSEVTSYLKAAAAARKSGNQAEMDKVRETGMDIWRKKYANTLAKKVSPTGQQLGTGQSVMAKQAAELRSLRDTAPAGTPPAGMTLSRQYQGNDMPGRLGQLETGYAGKPRPKPQPIVKKEAYDLVLDYLLSEGHAETVEEAHYVMMQLDAEHIQNIVESCGSTHKKKKKKGY